MTAARPEPGVRSVCLNDELHTDASQRRREES